MICTPCQDPKHMPEDCRDPLTCPCQHRKSEEMKT